jgi:hypothetical protein
MNKKVSLLKKIKIFKEYKKIVQSIKTELESSFGVRIDKAWRMYSVINIPIEDVGEPYNLKRSDIDKIAESSIKGFSSELSIFLDDKGLKELYDFYEVQKVDKYSYLLVFGFSLFKSNEYYDKIRFRVIPAVVLTSIVVSVILLLL